MVKRVTHDVKIRNEEKVVKCKPCPRILVLHSGDDVTSQYVAIMNAAFAARSFQVPVDSIAFAGQPAAYLELVRIYMCINHLYTFLVHLF